MKTISSISALAVSSLLLCACSGGMNVMPKASGAQQVEVTHAVVYTQGANMLSAPELYSLTKFIDTVPLDSVEHIVLEGSDQSSMTMKRMRGLEKILVNDGAAPSAIARGVTPGGVETMITLHVSYVKPVLPNCPDWSQSPTHNYNNASFSNFGCASATNLGRMVMDPNDLEHGHGNADPDATLDAAAVAKYHGEKGASSSMSGSSFTITAGSGSSGN